MIVFSDEISLNNNKMGCQCSKINKTNEASMDIYVPYSEVLKNQLEEYPVLVYSKTYCTKSKAVKDLLRKNSIQFEYFEIDRMSDEGHIWGTLSYLTNNRDTPYIFIKGKYYGSLQEIKNGLTAGELQEKLK